MEARRNCRVLVIDDSPEDIERCSRLLAKISSTSYSVANLHSGTDCLSAIDSEAPDCVILDYSMPGVDGIEMLERIRRTHPNLPVIMWSSRDEHELIQRSLEAGAQDFVDKSTVNADRLHAAISDAIPNGGSAAEPGMAARKGETVILIIDDSPEDTERCVRALKKADGAAYQVIGASGGADGLKIAESAHPKCILLDYSMPGQDGLEILRQLQSNEPFVPVIFMTGQGNESVAAKAIQGGAVDCMTKSSLNIDTLHNRIQSAIDDTARRAQEDDDGA